MCHIQQNQLTKVVHKNQFVAYRNLTTYFNGKLIYFHVWLKPFYKVLNKYTCIHTDRVSLQSLLEKQCIGSNYYILYMYLFSYRKSI